MTTTPYIHCGEEEVLILGEPQNLEALGHALLLKAKMGKNFQCTITDGTNLPIRIISSDDLEAANVLADRPAALHAAGPESEANEVERRVGRLSTEVTV